MTFLAATDLQPARGIMITDPTSDPPTAGYADATHPAIAWTEAFVESGKPFAAKLSNAAGSVKATATGAITGGAKVYAAASGQVAGSGTIVEGVATETVSASGDIVEVVPNLAAAIEASVEASVESVTADDAEGSGNSITAGATAATVGGVTNDANDFVVLPAVALVPIGHTIDIACAASSNFEMRTPASSGTTINNVVSDGTQEYLCTDTDLVRVTKTLANGWVAQSITALGAVRTAVVPD